MKTIKKNSKMIYKCKITKKTGKLWLKMQENQNFEKHTCQNIACESIRFLRLLFGGEKRQPEIRLLTQVGQNTVIMETSNWLDQCHTKLLPDNFEEKSLSLVAFALILL